MIALSALQQEMQIIKSTVPGIDHLIRVVTEAQATARLRDADGVSLLYTLPAFQQEGDSAHPKKSHAIILWVVEKPGSDLTDEEELELYEKLQGIIVAIKEYIRISQEDGCSLWSDLDVRSINIDPEYNTFGGFNGWVMAINF
jgi:hypothetical protein